MREKDQPDGRIHWMPDARVDARSHKLVAFPHFNSWTPIEPEIGVAAPKKPVARNEKNEAHIGRPTWQVIVREFEKASCQVDDGQKRSADGYQDQKHLLERDFFLLCNCVLPGSIFKGHPDGRHQNH